MIFKKHPRITFYLLNVIVAFAILFVAGLYTLKQLKKYTDHGHFIIVPLFKDLTVEEAEAVAAQQDLQITVTDSIYDDRAQPGTVQEQYPLTGSLVKSQRLIHLIVNASAPETVTVPRLNNSSHRQTLQTLEAKGFQIGRIEYEPSEFKNLVLKLKHREEEIEPGTRLSKGATIDIVLGSGNGDNAVPLPRLNGLGLNKAISRIRESYLNVGEIVPDESVQTRADRLAARVYKQEPAYYEGSYVQAGREVTLYITRDKTILQSLDSLFVTY
ncbi:MAG: PASTA domain-containing protein [Culturomica sp.]|jgi:hypothetical protein|nr:PASTA domain-containing protein [Culturomica sp.]